MPLYEYMCADCARRYSLLLGVTADSGPEACPHCGGRGNRLISRFARPALSDDSETASLRDWAGEIERETGEPLGEEFDEYLDGAGR